MSKGRLAKQLQRCLTNLSSFTDGQIQMLECDWEGLSNFTFQVSPNDGIYKGGRYNFQVTFRSHRSHSKPIVKCLTNIYHPNISAFDEGGNVCISLLNEWSPSNTLEDLLMALLFLFYNPNLEDPLSNLTPQDMPVEQFEAKQRAIIKGEQVTILEDNDEDLRANYFAAAKEKYEELCPEEWEVLAEAAKVEWSYKLEQEQWQQEIKEWEEQEKEQKRIKLEANMKAFDSYVAANKIAPTTNSTNYEFGKTPLQRFSTITTTAGHDRMPGIQMPERATVQAWGQTGVSDRSEGMDTEEEMDTTSPQPVPQHHLNHPGRQPFCTMAHYMQPALKRTLTFF